MWGSLFGLAGGRVGAMARGVAVPATLVVCATSALLVAEMLAASLLKRSGCCERHWLSAGLDPRSTYSSSAGSTRSRNTPHFLKSQFALHTPRRRSVVEPTRNVLRVILSRLLS